jgi:hypothetical protein
MNDTLEIVKKLATDPIPYVNTGIFLGMSAMDWDLALKVLLGLASIVWTFLKIINEYKVLREKSKTNTDK